ARRPALPDRGAAVYRDGCRRTSRDRGGRRLSARHRHRQGARARRLHGFRRPAGGLRRRGGWRSRRAPRPPAPVRGNRSCARAPRLCFHRRAGPAFPAPAAEGPGARRAPAAALAPAQRVSAELWLLLFVVAMVVWIAGMFLRGWRRRKEKPPPGVKPLPPDEDDDWGR